MTNSFGAFQDGAAGFRCKCLDVGRQIASLFNPNTAFANEFIFRYDVPYGYPEFLIYNATTATNLALEFCGQFGANLPSLVTYEDVANFLAAWPGTPVVMDFSQPTAAFPYWGWVQAAAPINISAPTNVQPCPSTNACFAVNYNNLAYTRDGAYTDGVVDVAAGTPLQIIIPLLVHTGTSWSIVIWPALTGATIVAPGCGTPASTAYVTTLACTANLLTVNVTFAAPQTVNEVQVFADGARVYANS